MSTSRIGVHLPAGDVVEIHRERVVARLTHASTTGPRATSLRSRLFLGMGAPHRDPALHRPVSRSAAAHVSTSGAAMSWVKAAVVTCLQVRRLRVGFEDAIGLDEAATARDRRTSDGCRPEAVTGPVAARRPAARQWIDRHHDVGGLPNRSCHHALASCAESVKSDVVVAFCTNCRRCRRRAIRRVGNGQDARRRAEGKSPSPPAARGEIDRRVGTEQSRRSR